MHARIPWTNRQAWNGHTSEEYGEEEELFPAKSVTPSALNKVLTLFGLIINFGNFQALSGRIYGFRGGGGSY